MMLGHEHARQPRTRKVTFIADDRPPPPPIERGRTPAPRDDDAAALPTDARIKQKEKLKAENEAGIKPSQIPKKVEEGDGDCGEDLKD